MEQQFINLINKKITEHYKDIKNLLLKQENYKTKVDIQNVSLYFTFLESSLQQPYNRLSSVSAFIIGDDGQLTDRMYPFALIKSEVVEMISNKFSLAVGLANTLEVSGIDPEFESLCKEKHLQGFNASLSQPCEY